MKRFICLILALCILLCGCGFFGERVREPVTFYFLCSNYQEDLCCVIVPEEREGAGHTSDLAYMMALYQMGPSAEDVVSPLPTGTSIVSHMESGQIFLELSDAAYSLSDLEYSLACACLTLTCLDITEAEYVTVTCGSRSKTMTRDSLVMYDTEEFISTTEENQ